MHSFVYREGEPVTHMYIVKSGKLRVTTKVRAKEDVVREVDPKSAFDDARKAHKMKHLQGGTEAQQILELMIAEQYQILGEEDLIMGATNYSTSAECISQTCTLYSLTRAQFLKLESISALWAALKRGAAQKIMRNNDHIMHGVQTQLNVKDDALREEPRDFVAGENYLKKAQRYQLRDEVPVTALVTETQTLVSSEMAAACDTTTARLNSATRTRVTTTASNEPL